MFRLCRDMFDCKEFNREIMLAWLREFPFRFRYIRAQASVLKYYWSVVGTSVIKLKDRSSSVRLKFTAKQSVRISSPEVVI